MMQSTDRMNPMNSRTQCFLATALLSLSTSWAGEGNFEPLALTSDSYNQDMVVEKTATPPVVPVTTASMDEGVSNTGFTWFERGYVADYPTTGLPPAGSVFSSLQSSDHEYQMAPSYEKPNALLLDAIRTQGSLTLTTATNYVALSFLTSSGRAENLIQYTVQYGDRGSETGIFQSPNWYSLEDPAWVAGGRVEVRAFTHADVTTYNPRLYSVDVKLGKVLGPITRIDFALGSGGGHTAIFAVSGASSQGGPFVPIEVNGYDEDLVVEASALQPGFLDAYATATMDSGTANTRYTWFEKGYYPLAPECGLPAPGSLFVSESDASHRFGLAPAYTDNNAILVDKTCSNIVLTLVNPTACSGLSFLTACGNGPATNQCVVRYLDGTEETNRFISPDWLGNEPAALTAHGRISVSTRIADRLNADGPRLYGVDVGLSGSTNPVLRIILSPDRATAADAHTVVLAVSGKPAGPVATRPSLSIVANPDGRLVIRSTQPGRLQSCPALSGAPASWKDEGPIQQTLTPGRGVGQKAGFYRVVVP